MSLTEILGRWLLGSEWFDAPTIRLMETNTPSLSLETWRESESLVSEFQKVEALPVYRAMVQTMRNESPVNYLVDTTGADEKIKRLGVLEGYHMALNNLEVFGQLAKRQLVPEATFETPETHEPEKT